MGAQGAPKAFKRKPNIAHGAPRKPKEDQSDGKEGPLGAQGPKVFRRKPNIAPRRTK